MTTFLPLLQHSTLYGLLMSAALMALMLLSMVWNPAIWAGDYPPDIKAKVGPPDARTQKQKKLITLPFFGIMLAGFGLAVAALPAAGLAVNFANAFVVGFVMALVFNLVDLLLIDWVVFVTWQPRLIVLPGTEGMAGYRDYAFHFRAFLKGLVFCLVAALLVGAIAAGVQAIF